MYIGVDEKAIVRADDTLKVVDAEGVAEEVEKSILKHASMAIAVGGLLVYTKTHVFMYHI